MRDQSLINIGQNKLHYNRSRIEGHEEGNTYLVKIEKNGCKSRFYRATTSSCGCNIEITFFVKKCIDELGKWKLKILTDTEIKEDRTSLLTTSVQVYKS